MPDKKQPKLPKYDASKDKDAALQAKLDKMVSSNAIDGKVIWQHLVFPALRVYEHTTSTGRVLAIKPSTSTTPSDVEMMRFAASHGLPAPNIYGFYEVITSRPLAKVIVSDRVPGVLLEDVWHTFNKAQTQALAAQLRGILAQVRTHTQPFIGRPNRTPTLNLFHLQTWKLMGPFDDQDAFDDWLYTRLPPHGDFDWPRFRSFRSFFASEKKRRAAEQKKRGGAPPRFVLTHCDLSPRNIMVQGTTITGILGWDQSGFLPEWAEFVFAQMMGLAEKEMEKWWLGVIKQVGLPIDGPRKRLVRSVMHQYVVGSW